MAISALGYFGHFLCLLSHAPLLYGDQTNLDGLTIATSTGRLRGFIDPLFPNVRQFLGIYYAESTEGNSRWLPPAPKSPAAVAAVINATAFSPSCPQFYPDEPTIYSADVPAFNIEGSSHEDCLALSIWAPTVRGHQRTRLPVFAFIHGGGWVYGGAPTPYQIPSQWIQRSQTHLVVQINYRLNILGYPNARGLTATQQNLGYMDQRLGLEWVRDNIAAFDGDPERITLWGQSAGAGSADVQHLAHSKDPIASSLILDSGSAVMWNGSHDHDHRNFTFVAENVGCVEPDPQAEMDCMRGIPADTIQAFLKAYSSKHDIHKGSPYAVEFLPVLDDFYTPSDWEERYATGKVSSIPAIIGTNANEGAGIAPYKNVSTTGPSQELITADTELLFLCPAHRTTKMRSNRGLATYRYQYWGNFTNLSPRHWMGAYHCAELPLLFGTHSNHNGISTPVEYATSEMMQDLWLAFARNPWSGLSEQGWPAYTGVDATSQVMIFGRGKTPRQLEALTHVDSHCIYHDSQYRNPSAHIQQAIMGGRL